MSARACTDTLANCIRGPMQMRGVRSACRASIFRGAAIEHVPLRFELPKDRTDIMKLAQSILPDKR
jgi:hypothetical protein